jgi:hypothetical protein
MISVDFSPRVRIFVYLWLAVVLCAISSCTKSGEQLPAEKPTAQAPEPSVPQTAPAKSVESGTAKVEKPSEPQTAPAKSVEPGAAKTEEQQKAGVNNSVLVPIVIMLPKPLFIGTPQNIVLKNLEKPLGKPRPPFLAPAGTTNVASGKRIISSDKSPIIGEPELITDGNKDSTDGNYVQFGPGVQYITIDLGRICEVYAIVVWHLHKQPVVFFDVIVQTADDENFIENVKTLFNNDIDNSAGMGMGTNMHYTETNEGKLIDAKGVKTRYVRLYSNGYSLAESNYYTEVEVYGRPI